MTKYIHKYIPGDIIKTMSAFDKWAESGGWIYWHERPKHPTILDSQMHRVLRGLIKRKMLRKAVLNPKWKG